MVSSMESQLKGDLGTVRGLVQDKLSLPIALLVAVQGFHACGGRRGGRERQGCDPGRESKHWYPCFEGF